MRFLLVGISEGKFFHSPLAFDIDRLKNSFRDFAIVYLLSSVREGFSISNLNHKRTVTDGWKNSPFLLK